MKKSIVVIFAVLGIILSSCKKEQEEKLTNTKYRLEFSYPNEDSTKGNFAVFTLPQDSTEDCDCYRISHSNVNKGEFSINPRVNQNGDTLPYVLKYMQTTTWNGYTAKVFLVDSVAHYPLVFTVDFPTYNLDQNDKLCFLYLHWAVSCKLFTRDGRYLDSIGPFYDETEKTEFYHVFAVSNAGKFYQTDLIEYEKEQVK